MSNSRKFWYFYAKVTTTIVYGQERPIIIYVELHDALMIIIERNLSPDFHSKTDNAVRRGGAA